jgi:hypothetical protein
MLLAEFVSILTMQVYMPKLEYENDEVEELYCEIEEILDRDGKDAMNSTRMKDWNNVFGDKSY